MNPQHNPDVRLASPGRPRRYFLCLALVAATLPIAACAVAEPQEAYAEATATRPAPKRILFVGNSYLYYNDSLHNHVRRMVEESGPYAADEYEYKSATIGGASLSQHPLDRLLEPGRLGVDEPFDLVILQGGSGEALSAERREGFAETAERYARLIREHGADVALYMTHAYVAPHENVSDGMTDGVASMYVETGRRIGARVIPVGLAFRRAYEQRPDIELHKRFDGSHPSLLGTYLAACVVYASVYERSPLGLQYDYFGAVSEEDASFLQEVAERTVREFGGNRTLP